MAGERGFRTTSFRGWLKNSDLSSSARCVALGLWSYCGRYAVCWPSHEELADLTGLGKSTVKRAIRELGDHRVISIEFRVGRGRSNRYTFLPGPYVRAAERAEMANEKGSQRTLLGRSRSDKRGQEGPIKGATAQFMKGTGSERVCADSLPSSPNGSSGRSPSEAVKTEPETVKSAEHICPYCFSGTDDLDLHRAECPDAWRFAEQAV